jgi:tetratricopeptide (TPR) repeat protein/predicted Ser/Thr protein kinase
MPVESGSMLSHYRLVEKIGAGGMGVVWKAEDTVLGRTVAVKVLPADFSRDEERRRMFFDEARAASAVSTANVVQIYEFGRDGDSDFIVMEYVDGKPLTQILPGQPLPPGRVVEYGAQIARALARAHRAKIIHRDLKPGNLLVTEDGEVKVVDFGLATLYRPVETTVLAEATTRTAVGVQDDSDQPRQLAGTIPYMSPEQVRLEDLDSRSDIFSLGTVLYEMTTGQRPFKGSTQSEVMQEILKTEPVPVHDLVPDVPGELDRIISRAMAPRRGQRYQDAGDLAEDLKRLGQELEAGTSLKYQALQEKLQRERRRAWWMKTAAVVIALLLAGIGIGDLFFTPPPDPQMVFIPPLEVRGQEDGAEYFGLAVAQELAINLAQAENLKVLPVPESGELDATGTEEKIRAARKYGAGRLLLGSLTREGDTVHASLSVLDVAEKKPRILWGTKLEATTAGEQEYMASDLYRQVAAELGAFPAKLYPYPLAMTTNPELASSSLYIDALAELRNSERGPALPLVEKLLETFPDDPDVLLLAWEAFGITSKYGLIPREKFEKVHEKLMRNDPNAPWESLIQADEFIYEDNPEAAARFQEVSERGDLSPALRSFILTQVGWLKFNLGVDPEAGRRDLEEAIRLNPSNWGALMVYAQGLVKRGEEEEALLRIRRAHAIAPQVDGVRGGLDTLLIRTGRYEEGLLHRAEMCQDKTDNQRQEICARYVLTLHQLGREEEAREAAEAAEALEDVVEGTWVLAEYYLLAGDEAGALRMLRRYVERADRGGQPLRANWFLTPLRGNPEFDAVAAVQWEKAVKWNGEKCASEPNPVDCSHLAVALQLLGRDAEAREAAATAASLEKTADGCVLLAWYHACARNRDEVIRYLTCYSERAEPDPGFRLGEHQDYEWIRGDPKFDALAFRIAGYDYEREEPPE